MEENVMNNIDEQLRKIDTPEKINAKTQEVFDIATNTLDNDKKILGFNITFDNESSMLESLKSKLITFTSDRHILDICNNRDMCISALQQDIKFCDEIQEQKKLLAKAILDIKELQTPPTFEYPDFKPKPKPVFAEKMPNKKSPSCVYHPFMSFCSDVGEGHAFEDFHTFIVFLFAVAVCFIWFVQLVLISSYLNILNKINGINNFLLEGLCFLVEIIIVLGIPIAGVIASAVSSSVREFLAKFFWSIVLFPVMIIAIIPVCLTNISKMNKYEKKVKVFNILCKNVENDNMKRRADYITKRRKEEESFWNNWNYQSETRNRIIQKKQYQVVLNIIQIKIILQLYKETRKTFFVPQEFDNIKTKKKLLNHLVNFRATTLTEAINKEDTIRFEKEQNKRLQEMISAQQDYYDEMESYERSRISEMKKHNEKLLQEQQRQREEANRRAYELQKSVNEKIDKINKSFDDINSAIKNNSDSTSYYNSGMSQLDVENAIYNGVKDALKNS